MATDWVLIDSSYMVYRAQYAMKEYGDAVIGFFASMQSLRERFDCDQFAFFFDGGKLLRCNLLPGYKERKRDPLHEEEHKLAKVAMNKLRCGLLSSLGFSNILYQEGYEADDLIAYYVLEEQEEKSYSVIVSSDADLCQLIRPNVVMYNPTKEQITDEKKFKQDWGLEPAEWWKVKAIAGCTSDCVPGVPRVGDKTAAKYLRGDLPEHHATYKAIITDNQEDYENRRKLVQLPWPGVSPFSLVSDRPNWRSVQLYGAKTETGG